MLLLEVCVCFFLFFNLNNMRWQLLLCKHICGFKVKITRPHVFSFFVIDPKCYIGCVVYIVPIIVLSVLFSFGFHVASRQIKHGRITQFSSGLKS